MIDVSFLSDPFVGRPLLTDEQKEYLQICINNGATEYDLYRERLEMQCGARRIKIKAPIADRWVMMWEDLSGEWYIFLPFFCEPDVCQEFIGIFKDCYGINARMGFPAPSGTYCGFCCKKFDLDILEYGYIEPPAKKKKPWWKRIFG